MRQQYKITLGDDLRAKLDAASEISGRPVSEEIRRRLDQSFSGPAFDEPTRELGNDVMWLTKLVREQTWWSPFSSWHDDALLHRALSAAIASWLEIIKPKAVGPESAAVNELFNPEKLGQMAANNYKLFKEDREELASKSKGSKP
jgi:hypothetical protein